MCIFSLFICTNLVKKDMSNATHISNSNCPEGLKGGLMSACVSSSSFSDHHARMVAAFDIVSPAKDWRDPIMMSGSQKAFDYVCAHHGVTLDDVIESVEYFTATKASVSTDDYGLLVISAAGYRAGPAGC